MNKITIYVPGLPMDSISRTGPEFRLARHAQAANGRVCNLQLLCR